MATGDNFDDWLEQFTYLGPVEIAALPEQQQSLVLAHKFAQATNCDGAGFLFYNDADMVDDVAKAFDELSELELAKKIRAVSGILRPFCGGQPSRLAGDHYRPMYGGSSIAGCRAAG